MIASIVHPWCQKVLPLTYDESLSYYEQVCKLVNKVNEVIDTLNGYDEVIAELREALQDIDGMKQNISELQLDVANLQTVTKSINNTLEQFMRDTNKRLDEHDNSISAVINAVAKINADIDGKIEALRKDLTRLFESFTDDFTQELEMLQLKVNQMKVNLQGQIDELNRRVDEIDTSVVNPWHREYGRVSPDKNNAFVYQDLADEVPLASEYSELGLTAQEYKDRDITAMDYVRRGKKELHMFWVYSPTYGWRQEVSNVFTSVINYVSNTLTADEYSLKDMDADEYSALDLNAQQYYYWRGESVDRRVIFNPDGTGLTRSQYRHMDVNADGTVSVRDEGEGITSNQYDRLSIDSDNNLVVSDTVGGIDRSTYERLEVTRE